MPFVPKIRRRPRRLLFIAILFILFFFISSPIRKVLVSDPVQPTICSQLCPHSSQFINETLQFDSSHIIRHFPNFVCPQNFRNLADWIYGWPNQFDERIYMTTDQGKNIAPCLPSGSIIYVRIWAIDEFFNNVYPHLKNRFVLVTGEGDRPSPIYMQYLNASDSKIIHWFGQNGQYHASAIRKFTHLPIGINCYEMANGIQSVHAIQSHHTMPPIYGDLDEPSAYIQPQDVSRRASTTSIPKKNFVLLNFDIVTDRSKLRRHLWKTICHRKNQHNFTYATCIVKNGGVDIKYLPKIYERNRQYPFWLSPRGGGIDCHRTWEALYLDIIPIVWNSSLNVLYENLPVVIINDYKELNETFLFDKLKEISTKKLSNEKIYHYEKLRNAYWRRLILNKSRHRSKTSIHRRTEQCWSASTVTKWQRYLPFL